MKVQSLPFKERQEAMQEIKRQVSLGMIKKCKLSNYNKLIDSFLWDRSQKGRDYWEALNQRQFNKIAC